ncbi:DUF2946 family protein [Paracidovorax anthurii]|uniref:DUF2946 family protein n=1 Tax=Paracidovorax anthurii TaxID=78229 RepID=A0A328YTG6_9BURK|nr:DUF2946 family protein [Paracidovorax anthurii]RAR76704.1 Protein of unknown function (DUF2946) [Paracidovorax anthurii]
MDDIVKQAIARWPHVPDCYGWLGLDARGRWFMRDDAVQAQGPFPGARGALLQHEKLIDFIHRNYEADAQGRWFFQNGPQRVYVELEATPVVWRVEVSATGDGGEGFSIAAHTGMRSAVRECLLDEAGRLYLFDGRVLGLVHTLDMELAARAVERGLWVPAPVQSADLPRRYGYVVRPSQFQV